VSAIELTESDIIMRTLAVSHEPDAPRENAHAIARNIAHAYGISVDAMMGSRRLRHLADARRELYLHLRAQGWSFPAIGKFCGGRDHTTVMAALKGRSVRPSDGPDAIEKAPSGKLTVKQQQARARAVQADEPWLRGGKGQ
jgi:hypothetical protein